MNIISTSVAVSNRYLTNINGEDEDVASSWLTIGRRSGGGRRSGRTSRRSRRSGRGRTSGPSQPQPRQPRLLIDQKKQELHRRSCNSSGSSSEDGTGSSNTMVYFDFPPPKSQKQQQHFLALKKAWKSLSSWFRDMNRQHEHAFMGDAVPAGDIPWELFNDEYQHQKKAMATGSTTRSSGGNNNNNNSNISNAIGAGGVDEDIMDTWSYSAFSRSTCSSVLFGCDVIDRLDEFDIDFDEIEDCGYDIQPRRLFSESPYLHSYGDGGDDDYQYKYDNEDENGTVATEICYDGGYDSPPSPGSRPVVSGAGRSDGDKNSRKQQQHQQPPEESEEEEEEEEEEEGDGADASCCASTTASLRRQIRIDRRFKMMPREISFCNNNKTQKTAATEKEEALAAAGNGTGMMTMTTWLIQVHVHSDAAAAVAELPDDSYDVYRNIDDDSLQGKNLLRFELQQKDSIVSSMTLYNCEVLETVEAIATSQTNVSFQVVVHGNDNNSTSTTIGAHRILLYLKDLVDHHRSASPCIPAAQHQKMVANNLDGYY